MIRPLICLILCLGCDSAAHDTRIDDAFVQCVAMQFQFGQVKESAPNFEIPAIELKSSDYGLTSDGVVALYIKHEAEISKIWGKMEDGTMEDAVVTWLGLQAIKADKNPAATSSKGSYPQSNTPAAQGEREDATSPKELTPAAAKPAVPVRTTAPLILFGYEGCAACKYIHEGLRDRGIPHSYRLVQPKPGVEYPFATSDGKHMNYNRLKELIK